MDHRVGRVALSSCHPPCKRSPGKTLCIVTQAIFPTFPESHSFHYDFELKFLAQALCIHVMCALTHSPKPRTQS